MTTKPIPGALNEWVEIQDAEFPGRWGRTDHPQDGEVYPTPPKTFAEYYAEVNAQSQMTAREDVLLAVPEVAELRTLLGSADVAGIDAWADDNASTLPELRAAFRTALKLLAARL